MVQQTDFEDGSSPNGTQVSTDLEITNTSGVQFENEIQLSGYTKEPNRKLSSSHASPSPQRKPGRNSLSTSDTNSERDSLSHSAIRQVTKKPVEGTPRTSTPEPRTSVSPRYAQQNVSGIHLKDILSGEIEKTKKLFYDSEVKKDEDATQVLNQENVNRQLPLEPVTTQYSHRDKLPNKTWYFDILQRLEDLSWSYQNLETEYSFLEKLNDQQKDDLRKAKSWSKHLKNQNASNRAQNKVY